MPELDLKRFWENDDLAHQENCFCKKAPQVALGICMSEECAVSELGLGVHPWHPFAREERIAINKRYNDLAQQIVGKRLLREDIPHEDETHPPIRKIGEVFGGVYEWHGGSEWLRSDLSTPKQLEARLDAVDCMDLRSFILPGNWEGEKARIYEKYGKRPPLFASVRGPVTLMTSLLGVENFIYLFEDAPELVLRASKTVGDVLCGYIDILAREAGYGEDEPIGRFSFYDDNCMMLNPQMYELFAYPILKRVFDKACPKPEHFRYQHSDSPMAHLLPVLARLRFTAVNFGPTLTVREIRAHMPSTRIDGQLAPFTFSRGDIGKITEEVKRDCEMAKEGGLRGLNLMTAGSINDGSSLLGMRAIMQAIVDYGQYR